METQQYKKWVFSQMTFCNLVQLICSVRWQVCNSLGEVDVARLAEELSPMVVSNCRSLICEVQDWHLVDLDLGIVTSLPFSLLVFVDNYTSRVPSVL